MRVSPTELGLRVSPAERGSRERGSRNSRVRVSPAELERGSRNSRVRVSPAELRGEGVPRGIPG